MGTYEEDLLRLISKFIDDKLEEIVPLMKDAREQKIGSTFHYYQGYRNALLCMAEIIIKLRGR